MSQNIQNTQNTQPREFEDVHDKIYKVYPVKGKRLGTKQKYFVRMLADLILFAYERGYEISLGDAYRDPRVFGIPGTKKSYSAANSLHKSRLAIDLNLFKDGEFLQNTSDHKELGLFWEAIGGTWGGRFGDGNHYSIEHNGKK